MSQDDLSRFKEYTFGGRGNTNASPLLLSEMEGTYQHLKYMGFREEMDIIDLMKKDSTRCTFNSINNNLNNF